MILRAKHNFIIHPFFKRYAVWIIKRHYKTIKTIGKFEDKGLPVLLISNHISWWDGFWAMYINLKVLKRKYHFMMLEDQLRKYWFFNYTGGFSVNKKSRSVLETIDYTRELLSDNKNMVLLFPQGEIQSMHNQNIVFENGLERILNDKSGQVHIVFLANLVDYFSNRKPGIYFYIQEYNGLNFSHQAIQNSYNEFYSKSVENQKQLTE
ncbi:MAG: lysophospholipid acyltransferase family protein [Bacteroidales bacterium]